MPLLFNKKTGEVLNSNKKIGSKGDWLYLGDTWYPLYREGKYIGYVGDPDIVNDGYQISEGERIWEA